MQFFIEGAQVNLTVSLEMWYNLNVAKEKECNAIACYHAAFDQ